MTKNLWACIGILLPFGSPNTPVDMGATRRFRPDTGEETFLHFLPASGIPSVLGPDRPREASPTGKSGMGIATYSQERQPIEGALRNVHMREPDAIYRGTYKVTQGTVDPYLTLLGKPTPGQKVNKWSG